MLKAMWHSTFFGDEKELKKLVDETTTTSKKGGNASANNSFPKKEYMKAWWKADPEKNKAYNEAKKELEKLKDEQKELDRDIDKNYSSMKALQAEDSIKTVTKALAKLRFYNDKIAEKESKFFQVGNAQKRAERLKELKKDRDNQYDFVRKEMGDPKNLVYTDREIQDLQINPSHYDKDYIKSHVGDRADQLRNKFDTVKDNLEKAQKKFDKADTELKEHNARKQAAQDKDDAAQRITDAEEKHRIALEAAQEATKTAQDEKKAAEEALRKAQQPSS
jgi:chromosome segregation ATPase